MLGKSISSSQYEKFTYVAKFTMDNYRIYKEAEKWAIFFFVVVGRGMH